MTLVLYPTENSTIYIPFATYAGATGASVTMSGLAVTDIEIYKNGSVTQRASDAGYALLDTDGIDFDSLTGIHGFSIDLSDNTTAGFYAVDSWYWVVVSSITVDSQTVNFIPAVFQIKSATRGMAGTALPAAAADAAGGLPISDAGGLDLDAQLVTALNNASVQAGLASSRLQGLVIEQGSLGATGNDTTHIHLDGLTYGDDEINSHLVVIHDNSVSEYHSRWITDWVLSTELATVATLPFTPESADAFWLLSIRADVTGGSGLDAAGVRAAIGMASANLDDQLSTIDNFVDDIESRLGTPSDLGSGATVAANLVDIESQTDDIGVAGAGLTEAGGTGDHLTAVPWNAAWDTQVESEVTDALNAYDPPTRAELTSDINSVLAVLQGLVLETAVIGSSGNDTTHIHLDGLTYGDDEINNHLLVIFDASTSEYHARWITDWVLSTELATVATLPFTPQNATDTFYLLPIRQDVTGGSGLDAAGVRAAIGLASANLDTQLADIPTVAELGTEIDAVQSDIAALNDLDAAGIRTAVGLASDNLDTQLAALPTATENADATLSRGVVNVEDTANTTSLAAVILGALESDVVGTTWEIRKTTGTTFVNKTVTLDGDGHITGVT